MQYERRLEKNGEEHDEEVFMLKKAAEKELAAVGDNYKAQLSHLRDELYEKTTLYEEMMERHLAEMRAKQVPPITQTSTFKLTGPPDEGRNKFH